MANETKLFAAGDDRSSQVRAVIDDCLRRRAAGEPISDNVLIAANPELMPDLGQELRKLRMIAGARAMAAEPIDPVVETRSHRDSDTGSGHLEVRCPSCHASMEVAVDTQLTDLTCTACGSHFSLVDQSKATRLAPSLSKMGRFELIERLGIGAFGSVWKARDKELDRTVAIKIPRAGDMSAEDQEKFFREARAAAQLRHPSIVSVHEVGRDGDSIYIVSDFVRGVTLGDWLTGQKLTSREAVELCAKIADALHHAHEQGVVHRDLKPADIMMDFDGEPHLMDFGLARRDTGEVTMTVDGHILGTPAYMSPEQAEGRAHTADRRSDVYSLGVILFQLLTGELPFRGNARMLIKQVIQDEPPSPRKLNASIPRDLETITLKCLEKDPAHRYQTANGLSEEFRRQISGEPVLARPIGRAERAVRWMRRNRTVSAASAVAMLALVGGTVASSLFAIDARHKSAAALAREIETSAVLDFVENKVFAAARPEGQDGGLGHEVQLRQAITAALPFVEISFVHQPLIEARLRSTLGLSFHYLGETKTAVTQFEKARAIFELQAGPAHTDTIQCVERLAVSYDALTRHADALKLREKLFGLQKNALGIEHPNTLSSMSRLARSYNYVGRHIDALQLDSETLRRRRSTLGFNNPDTLNSMEHLAFSYRQAGREADALKLREELFALRKSTLGPAHHDTLRGMNQLAASFGALGRDRDAIDMREQSLALQKGTLGADHPATLQTMDSLASSYYAVGQHGDVIRLQEESLSQRKSQLGPEHPATINNMDSLAGSYQAAGRDANAIALRKESIVIRKAKLGADDSATLSSMNNLADTYLATGKHKDAIVIYEDVLNRTSLQPDTKVVDSAQFKVVLASSHSGLAQVHEIVGDHNKARQHYEQALAIRLQLVKDFPHVNDYVHGLSGIHANLSRLVDTSGSRANPDTPPKLHSKKDSKVQSEWQVKFFRWQPGEAFQPPANWQQTVSGEPLKRIDSDALEFNWQLEAPQAGVPADNFGVVANTELQLRGGRYRIFVAADDGVRVYVNDSLIADYWNWQQATTKLAEVTLDDGFHSIRVEYFEASGAAAIWFAMYYVGPVEPQ